MMKKRAIAAISTLVILIAIIGGCNASRTAKGGAAGAGAGAAIGGVIGKQIGNTAAGAIIGAAIGGTAGAAIGRYMDRQAEELQEDLENARIERVGEGIKITFPSGILFDIDSDNLRPEAEQNLEEMSTVLSKYKRTNILIEGHTDSTGTEQYNQDLSERRAESVSRKLKSQGVQGGRITTAGYGEIQPITSNDTPEGRQANRRVEVAIFADEELKEAAREGELKGQEG